MTGESEILGKTNPLDRIRPIICGLSITAADRPGAIGSLGCFVNLAGLANHFPAGNFLLTNKHIFLFNPTSERMVIQPALQMTTKPGDVIGRYLYGVHDNQSDFAIVGTSVPWINEVPAAPWRPGRRKLHSQPGTAQVGDVVYKFGAVTDYTRGTVTSVNINIPPAGGSFGITNGIEITGDNGGVWNSSGDSGSALIRYADDVVLGLNFGSDISSRIPRTENYNKGYAYQINNVLTQLGGGTIA